MLFRSLISFNLKVNINSLPEFNFEVNDGNYTVRKALQDSKIDTCVIFIGYSNWYIKFNGIINDCYSDAGDTNVSISGILYNEKIFENFQFAYKDKTISDILLDICQKTDMGLFTINNNGLSTPIDYCINPSMSYISFMQYILTNYTDNIWCIDPMYIMHVMDYESLFNQTFDKYTIGEQGIQHAPKDMIITTNPFNTDDFKLKATYYSINTNFGTAHIKNNKDYSKLISGEKTEINLTPIKNNDIGIGNSIYNTFAGFDKHTFPYYSNRINKTIAGKIGRASCRERVS